MEGTGHSKGGREEEKGDREEERERDSNGREYEKCWMGEKAKESREM